MAQPEWQFVANLGDASPLDYGGLFVYIDKTGVYAPEMERLELDDEEDENTTYTAYRVVLDKCTYINGVLSDNQYHPDHSAWFAPSDKEIAERPQDSNLYGVASYVGMEIGELRRLFCSDDPCELAEAYRAVLDYHGWDNGDSYPLKLTRAEAKERYPKSEWSHRG